MIEAFGEIDREFLSGDMRGISPEAQTELLAAAKTAESLELAGVLNLATRLATREKT